METLKQMTTFDDILICKIPAGKNNDVKTKRSFENFELTSQFRWLDNQNTESNISAEEE